MTGRILLVRHGQTAWNDRGYLQGQTDVPLSDAGHAEATQLATHLATAYDITEVITSPLRRAATTADYVAAEAGIASCLVDGNLQERSFGRYEGEPAIAAFDELPAMHPRSSAFEPAAAPPGGESVLDVSKRVTDSWTELVARMGTGKAVAVVTHTTPIRLILGKVNNEDVPAAVRNRQQSTAAAIDLRVDNTDVSLVRRGVGKEG